MKTCVYCTSDVPDDSLECPNCAGSAFTRSSLGDDGPVTDSGLDELTARLDEKARSAERLAVTGIRLVSSVGTIVMAALMAFVFLGFIVVWILAMLGWDMRF